MELKVNISEDDLSLAGFFANEFSKLCNEIISKNGKINIALSGGNTPKLLFKVLSSEYKKKIDWKNLKLFWVDERCVAPDSDESNFGMTKKNLLDEINIPEENIFRIKSENEPFDEAARYSEIVRNELKIRNGFPEFDLILLGVGDDGHTASIFPDQMELLSSDKFYAVAIQPATGQKRITLTGRVINNSERNYFLVTGKSKAKVVKDILEKRNQYLKYPAAHISNQDGMPGWYLDKDSASELTKKVI